MKSLLFFPICVITFCCLSCTEKRKELDQRSNKPHIILIMADDLGYETLGVYGSDSYHTPHLDNLAREGMRFDHCYSTPLCTPSRVQLMTGKYNFRNYVGFGLLDAKEKTFGHYMQQAGYKTLVAGKWQLWGNERQQELAGGRVGSTPEQAGFEDYCLWQIDERGSRYKDPHLSRKQKDTETFPGAYGPDLFVDYIESFMDAHQNGPMFIYYPMVLTHDPFVPTPKNPGFKDFDNASKTNDTTYFGEMVGYMDLLVGKIVKKTEDLGIRENTLILFIGDNGTDTDVTSVINGVALTGDKGNTTNAGTHVPMIANWKGKIKAGSVNENLIDFTDFVPTLLETAKANLSNTSQTDGHSFYPQLLDRETKVRDWIFCDYAPNWGKFKARRYVQDKKWKLYGNGAFYNLEDDPLEEDPLDTAEQPEALKPLLQEFKKVLETYNNQNP
ncbi:sulfatase-like hydrolase/transferase [Ulvibacterium sp.]|uniref:sulfatase-like hydrolase/transferase n=1 Tax=Ulvibacterium sp. TaxID=2665914 RepID=UPI002613C1C4|nr:sulfatase-like hydrolase/transferase [Ulvibacterium sp.]